MMKVITIINLIIDTAETAENLMTDTATADKWRQVKVNRNKITADTAALLGAVHKLRHFKIDLYGSLNNDST